MPLDVLSLILGGLGLTQGALSGKGQDQILEELAKISVGIGADGSVDRFLPRKLWESWEDALHEHTVLVVTGCHHFAEAFDRPCAYALKFSLDQLGRAMKLEPLHSLVVGDIWFEKEASCLNHRRFVVSIGGPAINEVSRTIVDNGEIVRGGEGWSVWRNQDRIAVFGEDPNDTLTAVQAFVDQDMEPYANEIW